ncbi:NADH-quinone oxidoreductase subunit L [Nocardioides jejuensis]|uniref:NADH-quinone oxidoreductase subunit L n=1 Tax=Nocardioides jejuensis TaxID=2502782 RepID=A0A4R1BUX3_9ACTN|nr:NADH-quinone oxidoreductase subunit L [Nocardioides jejuensis]TCJ21743.1 NADH-quinone oxidoreductase subunit L [Nocardioides jejuensis]
MLALIIGLPLLGAVVLLPGGGLVDRWASRWGHWLGVATVATSFVLGLVVFLGFVGDPVGDYPFHEYGWTAQHLWTFLEVGDVKVGADLYADHLSILFVLLITGVGSLIHLYSVGYMEHDDRRRRFFGYLNLFVAAMLLLVLGGNYLMLFLGWEGVGLASYLLIGFWQHKHSAALAARKAFVMNRVGDMGLLLAMFLMIVHFGNLNFSNVLGQVAGYSDAVGGPPSETTVTLIGLALLLAACGKSAQVPLQAWLLDAMEGPTPVSALIHAATMVTAGVYLIVRSGAIFEAAPVAQTAVIVVAVVTLLWGAVLGCAKDDIKKALAGSTMSQIGYMMLGAGLGPVGAAFAIFHLVTHGFFKANMFLGAGSVMHGMDDDVDMRHYGALRKMLPVTFLTFAMGYLAIIGFPGFSGFWSKDKIIETAFGYSPLVGALAMLGAGITGFYMTRLMLLTFFTDKRWQDGVHPHESPRVMTIPLMVLAALSVLGGLMLAGGWITDWLRPVVGEAHHEELPMPAYVITLLVFVTVAVGVATAWFTVGERFVPRKAPADVAWPVKAARADLYGDAINDVLVVQPTMRLAEGLMVFDKAVIDGVVMGQAAATVGGSLQLRRIQNGFVRSYALSVLGGGLLVVLALLVVNI